MPFELQVLGDPRLLDAGGFPVPLSLGKPFALLTYVACSEDPVPRAEISDLLWPGAERLQSRHSLRQALWLLRSALGAEVLDGKGSLWVLPGTVTTDLHAFRASLSAGRIAEARTLWRGPFLHRFSLTRTPGWTFWVDEVRQDLELRFRRALLLEGLGAHEKGSLEEALSLFTDALEVSPFFGEAHLARIRVLTELLRLDAAQEAIADAHRILGDDEGVQEEIRALEDRVAEMVRGRSREERGQALIGERLEFVGRTREIAEMEGLWRRTGRGTSTHALISGPAGIGKTRLAMEVRNLVEASGGCSVLVKGNRGESELRLGLGMDLVRDLLPLPGAAGISAASDAILKALVPSLANRASPDSGGRPPPLAPLLDAVTDLVASVSQDAPLFIFADDLQWADRDSRLLLVGLARRLRDAPCLLVGAARTGEDGRVLEDLRQTFLQELEGQEFQLGPLTKEEVAELLALLAELDDPDEADSVVARIHQVTRGNPLFIGELLKKLREDGAIRATAEGWVLETDLIPTDLSLPGNIRTLLKARMEGLSITARLLCAALARETRGTRPERLRVRSGLGEAEMAEATSELLAQEVVHLTDGGLLDFTHDELRDTAAMANGDILAVSGAGTRGSMGWGKGVAMALGAVAVIAALVLGLSWWAPFDDLPSPAFGGGRLVFDGTEPGQSVAFEVGDGSPGGWEVMPYRPQMPDNARWSFPTSGGETFWFGLLDDPVLGPDITRLEADGRSVVIVQGPGDDFLLDMAPDASEIVFASENPSSPLFSHSLFAARPDGSGSHLLLTGSGPLGPGRFSPDGDLFAVVIEAPEDTVAVIARDGHRVAEFIGGEVGPITWCGSTLVAIVETDRGTDLRRLSIDDGEVTTIAAVSSPRILACSPDGSALVHAGIRAHHPVMLLRDLARNEVHELPLDVLSHTQARWVQDRPGPVVTEVRCMDPDPTLEWGHRRRLDAVVRFSDGTLRPDLVEWESLDPEVVSVDEDGTIAANREGAALIVAKWGHSFRDTAVVTVESRGAGDAFLRERFQTLDSARWIAEGNPTPVVELREGEPVLILNGDEKYWDGLTLRDSVPMARGVTVEWEFRLDPTQNVHQSFHICLIQTAPPVSPARVWRIRDTDPQACFGYPARELAHFDPAEAVLEVAPGVSTLVRPEGAFPARGWTPVAIQVRADGEVSLFVNREHVATSPVHLFEEIERPWTIRLSGKSVGAEVWLRDLVVWEELRYLVRE